MGVLRRHPKSEVLMKNIPQKLDEILRSLHSVRQQANGSWVARCPAHPDENPSLHIRLTNDRVLLHCFAGCTTEQICAALGIELRDLFLNDGDGNQESRFGLTLEDFAKAKRLDVEFLSRHHVKQSEWRGKPAVAFVYRDADGDYWAIRYRIAITGDRFRWEAGASAKRLLYGAWLLREWRQRNVQSVLLVEGESDALTLWQAGIPAVGVPGAESLTDQNAKLLDGFNVVLWREPDNGGETLLERAHALFGNRLRIVTPPDGIKDASELWLRIVSQHSNEADAEVEFRETVQRLMAAASDVSVCRYIKVSDSPTDEDAVDLGLVPEPEPMDWVVDGIVPARFVTNLYADSGHGKSFVVLHLALCCLTGSPFCGKAVKPGRVLFLDWELNEQTTAQRWYAVCRGGGFASAVRGLLYKSMTEPIVKAYNHIRQLVVKHKPVLVVIDSLGKALGSDPLDPKAVIQTYHALDQLGVAVFVVDHQPKSVGEAVYSSLREYGSAYKGHLARSRLQLERLNDAKTPDGVRVGLLLRHKKSNFSTLQADVHLAMTFVHGEAGRLHSVRFEMVQADSADESLGSRGEILALLREHEMTADAIAEHTGLARSTVSEHLNALRRSGFVDVVRVDGRTKVWAIKPNGESVGMGVPDGDVEFLEVDTDDTR
jgi:DNA-binding transcriptional ArsR family regulator